MRKLYAFITGFVFSLVLLQAKAQNDVTNFTSFISVENVAADNSIATSEDTFTDSCRADYSTQPVNNTPL